MAVWTIARAGEKVTLTYRARPSDPTDRLQDCGASEMDLEPEVAAWTCEQAQPWDCIKTPDGTFIRMTAPKSHARA